MIFTLGLRPRKARDASTVELDPKKVSNTELLMQSRFAVGMTRLFGKTNSGQLVTQIDQTAAHSPIDRVRAAAAIAEVAGPADAVKHLDAIDASALPRELREDLYAFRAIYAESQPTTLPTLEREALVDRHGWFAKLALSHGAAESDAARRDAVRPAVRALLGMLAIFALGGFAFVAGIVLLVVGIIRRVNGRLHFRYYPPPPGRSSPFVESFALYLVGMIAVGLVFTWLTRRRETTFGENWWIIASLPLALIWPRLRGLTGQEIRAGFGWHTGRGVLREMACGVLGYVAGVPLLVVAIFATSVLSRLSGTTPSHPIVEEVAGGGGIAHMLQIYLLAAVFAPVVEESMFRGALYNHVRARLPWWAAALLVGVIFAAIHPQGWVGIPMLTAIAITLAILREWRGSIIASMTAHACVNGVTLTLLLVLTG
jgi:membrane protease YdiL (CAAX protease family)